jgi:antitoxin component YwqK of YwqJK toxin-antitoxin module
MKNITSIMLLSFLILSFTAQNPINQLTDKGEKIGPWVGYYSISNNKRYEGAFQNDKPVGQFIYYADKGHVSAKINFINDSISKSIMYHENGIIMAKGKFVNKLKVGKWSTYIQTGDLLNIYNYKLGKMDGPQFMYYPENNQTKKIPVMEEFYCVNGIKDGIWKQYYELGTFKAKGQYSKGLKQGRFEYYFLNGNIDKKGRFIDDKKHGLWYFYDIEEEIMKEHVYNMGDLKK